MVNIEIKGKFTISFIFILLLSLLYDILSLAALNFKSGLIPLYQPDTIISIPWGNTPWSAGRLDSKQSAAEGPMSFTLSEKGEIYILDQVNKRILVFLSDGTPYMEVPIDAMTYQDIVVDRSEIIILLDRLAGRHLSIIDESGSIISKVGIQGEFIPEGGGITAMFLNNEGLWLEYDHEYLVKILDESLNPCVRKIIYGRFFEEGFSVLRAEGERPNLATIARVSEIGGYQMGSVSIVFDDYLSRIVWLEADANKNIYFMVELGDRSKTLYPVFKEISALRFNVEFDSVEYLFSSYYPLLQWEQFKEFHVTKDGSVFHMVFTAEGVKILKWRKP